MCMSVITLFLNMRPRACGLTVDGISGFVKKWTAEMDGNEIPRYATFRKCEAAGTGSHILSLSFTVWRWHVLNAGNVLKTMVITEDGHFLNSGSVFENN